VSYNVEALVTGKAIYGMDARLDGMVYASVERPPVLGGRVKSYDEKEALKVAGVRQTVPIDPFQRAPAFQPLGGIAVIAYNTWAAFQGRKKLNISWDNGPNETYNSDAYKNELRKTSHNPRHCVCVRLWAFREDRGRSPAPTRPQGERYPRSEKDIVARAKLSSSML